MATTDKSLKTKIMESENAREKRVELYNNNRDIAEFIGIKYDTQENYWEDTLQLFGAFNGELPDFHTSWDWLMPVVEKINGTTIGSREFEVVTEGICVYIKEYPQPKDYINVVYEPNEEKDRFYEDLKTNYYNAVVEFVKFYNKNKED